MVKKIMLILLLGVVSILYAERTNFDTGSLYIDANEDTADINFYREIVDDFFARGNVISFSGVADDLYLIGRKIFLTGSTTGGATTFGETIVIDGEVNKNLHSGGKSVKITGTIKETAFIVANNITISEGAVIHGTLISGASIIHILGKLNSGLIARAGEIIIDGPIVGNVNVKTGKLIITERGSITGNLNYGSNREISVNEKERVTGNVTFEEHDQFRPDKFSKLFVTFTILFYLGLIISGLLLLLLPGIKALSVKALEPVGYLKTMLWGLIPIFIFPVLLLVTIPLFPISIALGLSVFPLFWICTIIGLIFTGQLLFKLFGWGDKSIFFKFLLAVVLYIILVQIPFIKILIMLAIVAIGAGTILSKLFKTEFK